MTGGQKGLQIPQQPDQDGHADQEAEIEILCVKHTLFAVAKAAAHRVKLGAKEIEGLKMSMVEMRMTKNTLEEFAAPALKKILVFFMGFAGRNPNMSMVWYVLQLFAVIC